MPRPIDDMLRAAARRASGHMPGHKGRDPFGPCDLYALDTTELPVTDDLYHASGAIAEAQRLWAERAGAGATLFLTDGSTAGIHVMLGVHTRPGDRVLLPRSSHLSAVSACALLGLEPVWIPAQYRPDGSMTLTEDSVLKAAAAHPEAKTLLLTRPDYYGRCIPLEGIAAACRSAGIFLAVDEAHGAHFPWLGAGWSCAGSADAWVQSVHKTLPGLTGSAAVHLRRAEDMRRALALLRRVQTSSPSFLLMRSIDDAREWMDLHGAAMLSAVCDSADGLRSRLSAYGLEDGRAGWDADGSLLDPARLIIGCPAGGEALARFLASRGYDCEMWDERRAVVILTAADSPETVAALESLLAEWALHPREALSRPSRPSVVPLPETAMGLREAALAPDEPVPLSRSMGRISSAAAGIYPPGIPLIAPGEVISEQVLSALISCREERRFGTEGDCIPCVLRSYSTLTER